LSPGRPPFYKTTEELQIAINAYFDSCGVEYLEHEGKLVRDKNGVPIVKSRKSPTVTGLALALGFSSRQSLINYQGKKAFVDTITHAKLKVENYAEQCLFNPEMRAQGPIFALKNFGWKDTLGVSVENTPKIVIMGPEEGA
jgi:hypothetical protein